MGLVQTVQMLSAIRLNANASLVVNPAAMVWLPPSN
jgi:hypothetical protein